MKNMNVLSKIIPFACFIFIIIQLLLVNQIGVAFQYELSIYTAYPVYFWILFVVIFFLTFLNVFLFIDKKTNLGSVALTILAAINSLVIFLLMPFLRNYYFYNPFDSLTHLGHVNDIFAAGNIHVNYYPLLHILIYEISAFSQIEPKIVMFFVPVLFALIFISFMFLLVRSNTYRKEIALIAAAFAILPIFAYETTYVTPSGMAFLLIPIFLFLFLKTRTTESNLGAYSILLVLYLLIFPFFHLEVAVIVVLMLICIYLFFRFRRSENWIKRNEGQFPNLKALVKRNSALELILLAIIISIWFSYSVIFAPTINEVYYAFVSNIEQSGFSILQSSTLSIPYLLYTIVKLFGVQLFFILFAGFMILYLLLRKRGFGPVFGALTLMYVVLFILNVFTFFRGLILGLRETKYLILISLFFVSIAFYMATHAKSLKLNVRSVKFNLSYLIPIALIPIIALTVFSSYSSPNSGNVNLQVTEQSFEGYVFYVNHKDNLTTLSFPNTPQTFQNEILGSHTQYTDKISALRPVEHYGYSTNLTNNTYNFGSTYLNNTDQLDSLVGRLGNFYSADVYLFIDEVAKTGNALYTKDDLDKLHNDTSVNEIYTDGGIDLYYVLRGFPPSQF